jgi:hypothetical protein
VTSPSLATDPSHLPSKAGDRPEVAHLMNSDLVSRLRKEAYAHLRHGRLLLTGDRGAGKTGAMVLLLLEALRHRQRVTDAAKANVPVPVWLTLGSWVPSEQDLRDWVTATIGRDHPYLSAAEFGPMR